MGKVGVEVNMKRLFAVLLLVIFLPSICFSGDIPSKVGKHRELHILNMQDQDWWNTVFSGYLSAGNDTTLDSIVVDESSGSPQFFGYTIDIDTIDANADSTSITIYYKTKINPNDTVWYDDYGSDYTILSNIAGDCTICGAATVYPCNYLRITISNSGSSAVSDSQRVILNWWMKH